MTEFDEPEPLGEEGPIVPEAPPRNLEQEAIDFSAHIISALELSVQILSSPDNSKLQAGLDRINHWLPAESKTGLPFEIKVEVPSGLPGYVSRDSVNIGGVPPVIFINGIETIYPDKVVFFNTLTDERYVFDGLSDQDPVKADRFVITHISQSSGPGV